MVIRLLFLHVYLLLSIFFKRLVIYLFWCVFFLLGWLGNLNFLSLFLLEFEISFFLSGSLCLSVVNSGSANSYQLIVTLIFDIGPVPCRYVCGLFVNNFIVLV